MPRFSAVYDLPARYLILLSFFGYSLLAISFPLLPNYDLQPVGDIRTFAPGMLEGFLYAFLVLVLFVLYWLFFRKTLENPSQSLKSVLGIAALLAVPLFFMYPINANDVYRYVIRGLIRSRFGLSPFEHSPADFGEDLYPLLAGEWYDATSPYGPLWELIASFITTIGQENFLFNIILFKILGLISLLVAGVFLWMLFSLQAPEDHQDENRQAAFTVLWVLNPALLLSFVGNAHNDALMIAVLLAGWFVINLGYRGPGFLLLLTASLFKPIALLAAPIVFISSWGELKHLGERIVFLLWAFLGGALLLVLSFLPFGDPLPLILRLLREASLGASFSPLTLVILVARELGFTVSINSVAQFATVLFLSLYVLALWRTWRGKTAEQNLAVVFWGYVFQALNFRIWYASWPFPWLLLDAYDGDRRAVYSFHAGFWFLVNSQLSVIIYGHLRISFLGGSHLFAHFIGVIFVFFLPFVLARFSTLIWHKDSFQDSFSSSDLA